MAKTEKIQRANLDGIFMGTMTMTILPHTHFIKFSDFAR